MFLIFSMFSATLFPFSVKLIIFILPCFSNWTRFAFSISCSIFTAWEYVQSTSLAKVLPYLFLVFFLRATKIIAGFFLKKTSKISFFLTNLFPLHLSFISFFLNEFYIVRHQYLNLCIFLYSLQHNLFKHTIKFI